MYIDLCGECRHIGYSIPLGLRPTVGPGGGGCRPIREVRNVGRYEV